MGIKTSVALAALPVLVTIAPAQAGTFVFEESNLGGNSSVGHHSHIKTTYDNETEVLTWSSTFTRNSNNGNLADGAWLVLSDGENPKHNVDEYAIFYLDGDNGKVSAYNYNGVNSPNSYLNNTFLESTALTVTNNGSDERTFEFSIDASDINDDTQFGSQWKGIGFGENIGLWFHGVDNLTTGYDADALNEFTFSHAGWYDSANEDTTKIPEPGSVAALGLFAVAATKLRKRLG